MEETYTLVANQVPRTVWIFGLLAVAVIVGFRRLRGMRPPMTWPLYGVAVFFGVGATVALPVEAMILSLPLGSLVLAIRMGNASLPLRVANATCGLIFWGMAWITYRANSEIQFVLQDKQTSSHWGWDRPDIAGREGLVVTQKPTQSAWWLPTPWSDWQMSPGEVDNPSMGGSGIYWGPNGLIKGDDLGRYIAKWAGTTPQVREEWFTAGR